MSNAARKARKRNRQAVLWAASDFENSAEWIEQEAPAYQHPTREGIPYGNSKQPNLSASLPSAKQIEQTARMVAAAREGALWY